LNFITEQQKKEIHLLNIVIYNQFDLFNFIVVLGSMLVTGELGFEDEELGMNLLELAANAGHENARKLFNEFSLSMIEGSDDEYETEEEDLEEGDIVE